MGAVSWQGKWGTSYSPPVKTKMIALNVFMNIPAASCRVSIFKNNSHCEARPGATGSRQEVVSSIIPVWARERSDVAVS